MYSTYKTISERVKAADEYIMKNGYHPYYLYRQKNTIGGLENTGFSKKGAVRSFNYKYPLEYIKNFSQVETRKKNFEKELKSYLQIQ